MFGKPAPKASFLGVAPQFAVADVVQTAKYYCRVLGFRNLGYFLDPPVFAMVERDGIEFHFGKTDLAPPAGNATRRKLGTDAYIRVAGLDKLVEEFRANGAAIVEGPIKRIYGMREFVVEDCNGFKIAFGEDEG